MSNRLPNDQVLNYITQILDDKQTLSPEEIVNKYSEFVGRYPVLAEKALMDDDFDIEMLKKMLNVKAETVDLSELEQHVAGGRLLYQQYMKPKMDETIIRQMINTILREIMPFVKKFTSRNGQYRREMYAKTYLEDLKVEFKDLFEKYNPILLYIFEKNVKTMTEIKAYLDYFYL